MTEITKPNHTRFIKFTKHDKDVGFFDIVDGKMHFEGDLTESGKLFVEWVLSAVNKHIDDAVKAEREECAKFIEDGYVRQFEWPWRQDLAAAIRARSIR